MEEKSKCSLSDFYLLSILRILQYVQLHVDDAVLVPQAIVAKQNDTVCDQPYLSSTGFQRNEFALPIIETTALDTSNIKAKPLLCP